MVAAYMTDESLSASARLTGNTSRVLQALADAGLRGLTLGDLHEGLEMDETDLLLAVTSLTRPGGLAVRANGVYSLSATEWARRIDARRADRFAGSAATFQRDVAAMLLGKGEA
jgi:hypothetical protein